ncbi:MAG: hypothetical protein LBI13_02645 [Streptococcaceae bacterium]|jgi:hypothetical protein|nr:hypothetical protein [Streptococcaceae bacterium]
MMRSFHDYEIKNYKVEINGENSYIEFIVSSDSMTKQIIFDKMLAFKIEDVNNFQNVILDILELNVDSLVQVNSLFFEKKRDYMWPIDFDTIQDLKDYLVQNSFKAFIISSSLGLNGWIIAKEMKVI